ncbi:NfeD family protein [Phenylobacterium hankyongense]|uniref:NfeD family protein n=1 Tax=Phenylobacterium hankyongense TaxID=1813876 RepID=A0A328B2C7_9CAUL|nr:NfeD family protein [Phenylobacterium hankyongense]RAK60066.1 NfeD family protein [Phenylobacterium hankyongense]
MPSLTDLYLQHPFWVWMALGAALLAVEVATGSGWMLWPAASAALVAVLAEVLRLSLAESVLGFAVLTIASTLLARRYFPRSPGPHAHDINDNVARLVGHQGKAVDAFHGRAGRVFIDGKEWAAELDDGEALDAGARVEVIGVRGAHLRVRGIPATS